MKIEFFHDVICSFCFPMSYRMRQLKEKNPEIEIIHRSFALVPEVEAFDMMFGSREAAKDEIMNHWEQANKNDDLHRFNIEGMRKSNFLFPTSKPSLRAVKAAEKIGGNDLAWDAFDALQNALFVENKNIDDLEVMKEALSTVNLDLDKWQVAFDSPRSLEEVNAELELAKSYGISGVPFVVINGKYGINGAQPLAQIEALLAKVEEEEKKSKIVLQELTRNQDGDTCALGADGKWTCD